MKSASQSCDLMNFLYLFVFCIPIQQTLRVSFLHLSCLNCECLDVHVIFLFVLFLLLISTVVDMCFDQDLLVE